ncbi:MAG: molecular chaperone HtpG [Clostridiales bacterium]|jgi:molecular chaperone HtpG|nr:molecular chaperone HtpG [Clostridiales bacterium]
MIDEKGGLSINSENILPIIKKWLYSDTDIFARELVSNGADAVTKLKRLADMGEAAQTDEEYAVRVTVDKKKKQIRFDDNGVGMTADEVRRYINQIAFSGATDFFDKYKNAEGDGGEIIGHFGLGFYSAFMVSDVVEIDTLSYLEGETPVYWKCDGGSDYEMSEGSRTSRGTTVTLNISDDEKRFLDIFSMSEILRKYCGFLPVPIYVEDAEPKKSAHEHDHDHDCDHDCDHDDPKPTPINDTEPLWTKKSCSDEEYKAFYHKVFADFNDPLFWIHLNMDYPFRLKGILYFPRLKRELESIEGQVKLYSNQVFIADNIKEVIPEFMLLLKGTMDCPDLPLNVSRSFLQNDGYVAKMSGYITKKTADKINALCKKDRETFNGYWDDISPFIKYGCIREKDFYEKVKKSLLFKTTSGDYATLDEFTERNKKKTGDTVFYVSDERQQAQYVKLFKEQDMEAVILTINLDNPFISYIESYEKDLKFSRIDADLSEALKENDGGGDIDDKLADLFKNALGDDKLVVKIESLKTPNVSAVITQSEQSRRMKEMSRMFGGAVSENMFDDTETLVLNRNNDLVKTLADIKNDETRKDDVKLICEHIYDLAMIGHRALDADVMTRFIERSNNLLEKIAVKR